MTTDDIFAIQQAVSAYGAAVDTGDPTLFACCFTSDAELLLMGRVLTVTEYAAQCQKASAWLVAMQHQFGPTLLASTHMEDGTIGARTPFVAYHFVPGRPDPLIIGGEYEDIFCRTTEGWRIAKRSGIARWHIGDQTLLSPLLT